MGTGNSGANAQDPTIVSAFHTALYHQALIGLLILAVLAVGWYVLRAPRFRPAGAGRHLGPEPPPESDARRLLRIGFGLLWLFDGILQLQGSMPLGMVPQVIQPSAADSPGWVQHLVSNMATTWSYHPIIAATATVWIQVGIGAWLLVAPRGVASRLAGVASAGWGLVIWIFGESFGGIFAPGLSWLTGAPGAVLFYCVAGALIALPETSWRSPRLGRAILAAVGVFFVGMALLQGWPGRGFWQGGTASRPGSLASSVQDMAASSQPHWLSSWVASFGSFDIAHGWVVNLFVVVALAALGAAFLTGRPRLVRVAVVAATVLCLVDWVLVQDLGFLGGVGTDPNSMIPLVLVFAAGYLALSPRPAPVPAATEALSTPRPDLRFGLGVGVGATAGPARRALSDWRRRLIADPTYAFHSFAALAAIGVTLLGVAPMAAASTNSVADPILARATNGQPEATNMPTPAFSLVDQHGRSVSLASLQGKTVVLTFLDPTCAFHKGGCPFSEELRLADRVLGTRANRVELVAIDTNPRLMSTDALTSFDGRAGLDKVSNFVYLTGPLTVVSDVLDKFSIHVADSGNYNMRLMMGLPHGQMAYVIDGSGRTREVLNIGERGSAASKAMESSEAVALANAVRQVTG